jgi:hypothetical protein
VIFIRCSVGSILILLAICANLFASDTSNTISKSNFNFGHQSGYMYSRMGDAYFKSPGTWDFQTGFVAFYTSEMPMVRNDHWKERLMLTVPLTFFIYPCNSIELEINLTDLFVDFPYENKHNAGGKTPRFKTKMRLLKERAYLPAIAFTVGVAFSSAKPFTIWDKDHNYDESNGLAGVGTGVADYLLLFTMSKKIDTTLIVTGRIGLAPLGSPVEYERGSSQADEIPYGLSVYKKVIPHLALQCDISGMYNGLSSTKLAHYSVARLQVIGLTKRCDYSLNIEHGLTEESDEWVGGVYVTMHFGAGDRSKRNGEEFSSQ